MEKDLKSKTVAQLERFVTGLGQPRYLAGYIFSAIQAHGVTDISAITTLSKSFRAKLAEEGCYISKLEIVDKLTDPDGTVKYVFGLPRREASLPGDGGRVESVLLFDDDSSRRRQDSDLSRNIRAEPKPGRRTPHSTPCGEQGNPGKPGLPRRTICVSTQVGCAMGCVFCATGRLGLARNLTAGEIVDQVNLVARDSSPVPRDTGTGSRGHECGFYGYGRAVGEL